MQTNLCPRLQVALQSGTISLSVGTELFKAARLNQAESSKDATLANTPCTQNTDDYTFTVANYNDSTITSARERYLGLTNRVIGGMLLQTTRTTPVNCTDSRFSDIESLCKGGRPVTDVMPYLWLHLLQLSKTCARRAFTVRSVN